MKLFFVFVFSFILIFQSEANTDRKIKQQSNYLNSKARLEKRINRKLQDLATEIISQIKNLDILKKKIDNLDNNIAKNENNIKIKYKTLNDLLANNKELSMQKKKLEKKIINIIAKDFSYFLISDKNYIETKDSIFIDEIMDKMDVILKKEFSTLAKNYKKINKNISAYETKIQNAKKYINNSLAIKGKLVSLKKQRELAIKKLGNEKIKYKNRLVRLEKEKKSIRKTLEKLKILKKSEYVQSQKKQKLNKRAKKQDKLSVRQIGSSYQTSKVKKYRGKKTIAPLDSFIVKRKFGNYVDPVYNMKIFNESVILQSKINNAKVKNILNGKVVFAKDTAVLERVVIVENSFGIYTIYAHLSQIAPTIKVGKKIRKGYVIGRVTDDLTFEVTQKNYHINPLDLIRLN